MKADQKLIDKLNELLKDELTAINQYFVHAEMCEDWGYAGLSGQIKQRSIQEMKHAEALIERILFLEGRPIVSDLSDIHIGSEIPKMFVNDKHSEEIAIKGYNEGIKLSTELGDNATKTILEGILNDEDGHLDEIEEQIDQIEMMGLPYYLTTIKK
ncbi:MAG: bacterioferritin [Planctomycetota bacterium]|nr:bacterioferritin [Planctomycetota bacterium]